MREYPLYQLWYSGYMDEGQRLYVAFFRTTSGKEPVRDWLKSLPEADKKAIGVDIKTVQYGWPLGMPLVRPLGEGLWEVRIDLDRRTARVLFTVAGDRIVLLHGFFKKTQKTDDRDLQLARKRKNIMEQEG